MNQPDQRPKAALLQTLNRIRSLLRDVEGRPIDLLKNAKHPFSSLGIKLVPSFDLGAQPVANVISECVQGGPAHISGQIQIGDTVLAVNGTALDYGNVGTLLGSSNMLGAPCTLSLKRDEEILDVQLTWTSAVFARDMNMLFRFFESLETEIRKQNPSQATLTCLQELIMHTIEMEKNRALEEEQLAAKLLGLQLTIVEHVDDVETFLHHSMSNDLVPRQELIGAIFEAKNLHEHLVMSREREAEADKKLQESRSRIQELETQLALQAKIGPSDAQSLNASNDLSLELTVSKERAEGLERQLRLLLERASKEPSYESSEIRAMKDKITDLEVQLQKANQPEGLALKEKVLDLENKLVFSKQVESDLRWRTQVALDCERKMQKEMNQVKQSLANSMLLLEASKADMEEQVRVRKVAEAELADIKTRNAIFSEASKADLKEQLLNREKELAVCKSEIARLEARVSSLSSSQQDGANWKNEAAQAQQLINVKDAEISRLQAQLTVSKSRDVESEANRNEVARLVQLVASKDSETARLQTQLGIFKGLEQDLAPLKTEVARQMETIQRKDAEIAALQAQLRKEKENWSPLVVRTGIAELEALTLRARNAELEKFRERVQDQRTFEAPKANSISFQPLLDDRAISVDYLERELEKQRMATMAAEKDVIMHIQIEQELREKLQASTQEVARLSLLLGAGEQSFGGRGAHSQSFDSRAPRTDPRDGREKTLQAHVEALREKISSLEGQAMAQLERR